MQQLDIKDKGWNLDEAGVYVEQSHILTPCASKVWPEPFVESSHVELSEDSFFK